MSESAGKKGPASVAPQAPPAGEMIGGKYRMERFLGEGAMGTVVAAHHTLLDVPVAVKLLSPQLLRHRPLVERFLREARAAARLKSEHVTRVMDVGTLESGQPFIVMELLEGQDLDLLLERGGALPVALAVDFTLQTLEAMAHAHAAGIVHRDLKPANMFVVQAADGRQVIKVLDFGIAKLSHLTGADADTKGKPVGALTGEHATLGSPSYMAPEQVEGLPDVDARADIWAIGTVLYEMLTGKPAFGGRSVAEIFGAVLYTQPKPPRSAEPDVPEGLESAVMRCLKRLREERFQDVGELAAAIAPFGSGAYDEYVFRIARTFERSGRISGLGSLSNPGTLGRPSAYDLPPVSERRPRLVSRPDIATKSRDARANAETLLEASGSTVKLERPRKRRLAPVTVGAALVVAAVGAAAFLALRAHPGPDAASAAGSGASFATSAPSAPPSQGVGPVVAPTASAVESPASSAPASSSPSSGAASGRRAPRHAPSAPAKTRPGELPGVLNSPE